MPLLWNSCRFYVVKTFSFFFRTKQGNLFVRRGVPTSARVSNMCKWTDGSKRGSKKGVCCQYRLLTHTEEKKKIEKLDWEIVDVQSRVTPQNIRIRMPIVIGNAHVDYPKSSWPLLFTSFTVAKKEGDWWSDQCYTLSKRGVCVEA